MLDRIQNISFFSIEVFSQLKKKVKHTAAFQPLMHKQSRCWRARFFAKNLYYSNYYAYKILVKIHFNLARAWPVSLSLLNAFESIL